jgi:hypothetical protein
VILSQRNYLQIYCVSVFLALVLVASCTSDPQSEPVTDRVLYTSSLALADPAPRLVVPAIPATGAPADREARQLERAALRSASRASRHIEPAAAALLYGTRWGRSWLTATGFGALVRGEPPARCPALTAATAPTRGLAIQSAISACRDALGSAGGAFGGSAAPCDCRLIAIDGALLAPLQAFAYAPGTDGRIMGLGASYAGALTAREVETGRLPGEGVVIFGDARGPVATALLAADGTATLELLRDGRRFSGTREALGWARGRQTERLLLRGPDGERVIVLIGIDPAAFMREGPALAAWPRQKAG